MSWFAVLVLLAIVAIVSVIVISCSRSSGGVKSIKGREDPNQTKEVYEGASTDITTGSLKSIFRPSFEGAEDDIRRIAQKEAERCVVHETAPRNIDRQDGSIIRVRNGVGFELVHMSETDAGVRANRIVNILNGIYTEDDGAANLNDLPDGYVTADLGDLPAAESNGLCFARRPTSFGPMIPDSYHMNDYMGQVEAARNSSTNTPWSEKADRVVFYGASTGVRPPDNRRALWCDWSLENRDVSDIRITSAVQGYPVKPAWMASRVSVEDQIKNRYILSCAGNTAAWDRPAWVLASNSVLLMDEMRGMLWYYELLDKHNVGVVVNPGTIRDTIHELGGNDVAREELIQRQNAFSNSYLDQNAIRTYWKSFWKNVT